MINMHIHTNHSLDGTLDINEILNICTQHNIKYISITDHDTCEAYKDIKENNYSGVIIPGIEADVLIGKETYDILCYGFNLKPVAAWAQKKYTTIAERQIKIFNKLKQICQSQNISLDESIPYNKEKEYAHAAIFRMLPENFIKKYNLKTISDFYRESTINEEFPLYIDMSIVWPTIEEVKEVIHKNGGKIFLAHPYKYGDNRDVQKLLSKALKHIDGIEISNNPKDHNEVKTLYEFAKKNNLLISCGSDFHGNEKNNEVIPKYIDDEIKKEILSWIDKINNKIEM